MIEPGQIVVKIIRSVAPDADQFALTIPDWFDDPEQVAPCPCGQPLTEGCLMVEGDAPLKRWFHPDCLGFLEYEMDEDELEEKREWERRVQEDEDDDE